MRRQELLSNQVFKAMLPFRDDPDAKGHPVSWLALVRTRLMGETQQEILSFYGSAHEIEARYAGLDYSYPPHRRRLLRFPYHQRLFEAFDWLGLTPHEINGLCTWDGTLFAKQKYEREHNVKIRDTTADAVPLVSSNLHSPYYICDDDYDEGMDEEEEEELEEEEEDESMDAQPYNSAEHGQLHESYPDHTFAHHAHAETQPEARGELHSLNLGLNSSLLNAALAQDLGFEPDFNIEWDQWLKEYQESEGRWGSLPGVLPSQLPNAWQL